MAEAAAKTEPTVIKLTPRGQTQILQGRVDMAEFKRNVWAATPEEGTPLENLSQRSFWAHVASKFKPCDIIEVVPDDMSYFARFIVLGAGQNWADVQLLGEVQKLGKSPYGSTNADFEVGWKGPVNKWAVIRNSDKSIVAKGYNTRGEAEAMVPRR